MLVLFEIILSTLEIQNITPIVFVTYMQNYE